MFNKTTEIVKRIPFKYKLNPFINYDKLTVAKLPIPYQKFIYEWLEHGDGEPVHWIPRNEKWERLPSGNVQKVQNVPIHAKYPNEMHSQLWGGEGVIEGSVKKGKYCSPVPRFWLSELKETVIYSEIFDKYLKVVVTERALEQIDKNYGLDSYIIKTPAHDLKTLLALKLKRKLMIAVWERNFPNHFNLEKQEEIIEKYKEFLLPRDDLEWYGLSIQEAKIKFDKLKLQEDEAKKVPLKWKLKSSLINELKNESSETKEKAESSSFLSRLNPFSRTKN